LFIYKTKFVFFGLETTNLHYHSLILALFASFISPLGGFFASGFKRAIKIKDFSNLIPGHGGITDRMDCQTLMGFFTYLWIYSFTAFDEESKIKFIIKLITKLSFGDQVLIKEYLENVVTRY
jgi:phosphatidate cytidylyltransferase